MTWSINVLVRIGVLTIVLLLGSRCKGMCGRAALWTVLLDCEEGQEGRILYADVEGGEVWRILVQ